MPDPDRDEALIRKWVKSDTRHNGVVGVRVGYDLHAWSVIGQLDPEVEDPIGVLTDKYKVPRDCIEAAVIWYERYPQAIAAYVAAWQGASLPQMAIDIARVQSRAAAAIARSRGLATT